MINSVTVTNHLGESVTMELRFPEKSGFLIHDIKGLEPPKADIDMTEVSSIDGAMLNSTRVTSRNIVLSLGLLENPTIEIMRHKSYKYFPIKKRVELVFDLDNRICETYGYVESNDVIIFTKEEICIISIRCPDSYLFSLESNVTLFGGSTPLFEFPFSNESTSQSLIVMGDIEFNPLKTVEYDGEASVGVIFRIHAIGPVTGLEISNPVTLEKIVIDDDILALLTGSGIIAGDDLIISTVKGNKTAYLIRAGVTYKIINALGQNPTWFQLEKGDNLFRYNATSGIVNLQFSIENQIAYEGA